MTQEVINAEIVSTEDEDQGVNKDTSWLDAVELYAYNHFKENLGNNGSKSLPLAHDLQDNLFSLYLNGFSLSDIRKQNSQFGLGQIVYTAVDNEWNQKKIGYLSKLPEEANARLQQVASESVKFLAAQITAAHKMHTDALNKYLSTGDPNDLGVFGIKNPKQYREAVELLSKITGNDNKKTLTVKGEIFHTPNTAPVLGGTGKTIRELAAIKKASERQ